MESALTHTVKTLYCQEATDQVGEGQNCNKGDLGICSMHEFETIKKQIEVTHGGLLCWQDIEIDVATGTGAKSSLTPSADNKRVASDR